MEGLTRAVLQSVVPVPLSSQAEPVVHTLSGLWLSPPNSQALRPLPLPPVVSPCLLSSLHIHISILIRSFADKPPPFLREKYRYRVNLSPLHLPPDTQLGIPPPPPHMQLATARVLPPLAMSGSPTATCRPGCRSFQRACSPFWLAPILIGYHCLLLFTCFRV